VTQHIKISFRQAPRVRRFLARPARFLNRTTYAPQLYQGPLKRSWGATRQAKLSFQLGNQAQPCFLNRCHGKFAAHTRIPFQKLIQRVAPFQIVRQDLERNTRPAETGSPPRISGSFIMTLAIPVDIPALLRATRLSHPSTSTAVKSANQPAQY